MEHLHSSVITSLDELRKNALAWDDLWWRSNARQPTSRAELLAQWIEQFAPQARFRAIVVADNQKWIAALPLIENRAGMFFPAGKLPGNSWSSAGELMLDTTDAENTEQAVDLILTNAQEFPWQLLWLDEIATNAPELKTLLRLCNKKNLPACYHECHQIGYVKIDHNWADHQKRLPKSLRQNLHRALKRLKYEGEVQFEVKSYLPEELEPALQELFVVEDSSWKGAAGTSVIKTPGLLKFFLKQAQQLARWNLLEIATLRLDGRLLAFVYGYHSKGTYFVHKTGYDQRFAAFSPGQLLFNYLFEHLHNDHDIHALDFMGLLADWQTRWRCESYPVGRLVVSTRRGLGRAAFYIYKHLWRPLRDRNCPLLRPAGSIEDKQTVSQRSIVTPRPEHKINT